jgi:predicted anti-sigma-YlaC factor YlaD
MGKKCAEYIGELSDYLDGEVSPELCEEIEKHIGQCENCRIMVDTLKQTVTLCREGRREKLPAELEGKLNNMLRDKWRKKFGK